MLTSESYEQMRGKIEVVRRFSKRFKNRRSTKMAIRMKRCVKALFPEASFTKRALEINKNAHDFVYDRLVRLVVDYANRHAHGKITSDAVKRMIAFVMRDAPQEDVKRVFESADRSFKEWYGTDVTAAPIKKKPNQRTGPVSFESKFYKKQKQ